MSYINKEDLLATINEVWERKYARCEWKTLYDLYRMCIRRINRAQVADVVQVVRCKDCQYFERKDLMCERCGDIDEPCGGCHYTGGCTYDDGYCHHGERRKEDDIS